MRALKSGAALERTRVCAALQGVEAVSCGRRITLVVSCIDTDTVCSPGEAEHI